MSRADTQFDFDRWKALAESDSEAFERQRRELLQAEIELAPAQRRERLRGLQWQIDMTRRGCSSPAQSSAKLFEMMWQQVYGDDGFLDVLTQGRRPLQQLPAPAAAVLPFRRARTVGD